MKKKKPLKGTVTHYVAASGRKTKQDRKRSSMKDFFEDLENRGPFVPHSLFEQFAKTVRMQMQGEGKWIQSNEDNLDFVAEYVSRLLQEYRDTYLKEWNSDYCILKNGRFAGYQKHYLDFRKLYLKIRIWGLRTNRFWLRRWNLIRYPWQFDFYPNLWPMDYREKCAASEPTFRYWTIPYSAPAWRKKHGFFQKDELPEGKDSKNYEI